MFLSVGVSQQKHPFLTTLQLLSSPQIHPCKAQEIILFTCIRQRASTGATCLIRHWHEFPVCFHGFYSADNVLQLVRKEWLAMGIAYLTHNRKLTAKAIHQDDLAEQSCGRD